MRVREPLADFALTVAAPDSRFDAGGQLHNNRGNLRPHWPTRIKDSIVMQKPIAARHCRRWQAALSALLFPLLATAGDFEDVSKLMQRGANKEALALADSSIAKKPQDANLRFLKGVLLVQMERKPEAVEVFTALTREFPKLAEPHNNLGVLLAAAGDYDKARVALQRAVELAPGYAIAHENLGDLYARLSSAAYEKAAQLDDNNANTRSKLALARNLNHAVTSPAAQATAAPTPASTASGSAVSGSAGSRNAVSGHATAATGASPATASAAQEKPVLDAVARWASAWSARDMTAYLSAYAPDFVPPEGMSLKEWKAERSARIRGKREISVQVQQPEVRIEGDRATVKFVQTYSSEQFRSTDVKLLMLVRHGGKWLIQQERVAS